MGVFHKRGEKGCVRLGKDSISEKEKKAQMRRKEGSFRLEVDTTLGGYKGS